MTMKTANLFMHIIFGQSESLELFSAIVVIAVVSFCVFELIVCETNDGMHGNGRD